MGNRNRGNLVAAPIVIQQEPADVRIPPWVVGHASYRRWATSDAFPDRGQYAFLAGELWVDVSMERLGHNQIKTRFAAVLTPLGDEGSVGEFLSDRMLLTHVGAGLSTEPDGLYVTRESVRTGGVRLKKGRDSLEVEGTPDMVLEVVSPTSKQKDKVVLRQLYWRAGVREYWLVDPLPRDGPTFDILRHTAEGYAATRKRDGWIKSAVFGRSFRYECRADDLGLDAHRLRVK